MGPFRQSARIFRLTLVCTVWLWIFREALRLALLREYGLDEFTYAHGAWLTGNDALVYRDFFFHHFPGALGLLSPVFALHLSAAESLLAMRLLMLLLFLGTLALSARLASKDPLFASFTPLFLMLNEPFAGSMLSVRPDAPAFFFFLASFALLFATERTPRRSAPAGVLFALAVFTSEKALVWGTPLALFLIWQSIFAGDSRHRRAAQSFGAALLLASVALWSPLLITGGFASWLELCFHWNFLHERYYPELRWEPHLLQAFMRNPWLPAFGMIGIAAALRRPKEDDEGRVLAGEALLLATLVSTFFAFSLQRGAFFYSYAPFFGIVAIFAGRGMTGLVRAAARSPQPEEEEKSSLAVFPALLIASFLILIAPEPHLPVAQVNLEQRRNLDFLDELLGPSDPVYDNSGGSVSRPSVHYYYFTDHVVRALKGTLLESEIPERIEKTGCTAMLVDYRFPELSGALQRYLRKHFQPYTKALWLWGQRFEAAGSELFAGEFLAVKDGRYFVTPAQAADSLAIDGAKVAGSSFGLRRGSHSLTFTPRPDGPAAFSILWLPANGAVYSPLERKNRKVP